MAVLPSTARTHIALDTLVTRARGGAQLRPDRPVDRRPAPTSLAELERAARRAPHPHSLPDITHVSTSRSDAASLASFTSPRQDAPTSISLLITVSTCECGASYRTPNASALVHYGPDKSIHFRRASLPPLPASVARIIREANVTVPFCEACFA